MREDSVMPIRQAFRMKVHPGCEGEYQRRHRPIWAELEEVLRSHGVRSYSIFVDAQTQDLFASPLVALHERADAVGSRSFAVVGAVARGLPSLMKVTRQHGACFVT